METYIYMYDDNIVWLLCLWLSCLLIGPEPIPAGEGLSLAMQKAKPIPQDDTVLLSPRMSTLKKKE